MLKRCANPEAPLLFPWLNQRLLWPLRLATLVDDLDTATHNSRLRAQVQTEQKRVGQRAEYGSAGCGQPLTSDVDQRCCAVVANRAEAVWRYFHYLGLPGGEATVAAPICPPAQDLPVVVLIDGN
jgi:hypothetical protein